ncbi:MAG: hypothetical protein WD057_04145, partial [Aquisalimonadaceae bacterium]
PASRALPPGTLQSQSTMGINHCLPKWWAPRLLPGGVRFRHCALATLLLAAFVLAYGGTLAYLFNQASFLTQPGDRLVVVFPPDTPVATALERLGTAGAVLSGTAGMPWYYQAEAVDTGVAERLVRNAWVMRIPGKPTFAGCVAFVTNKQLAAQPW